MELYINYDCSLTENNVLEKIIDSLKNILLGKYLHPKFTEYIKKENEL